MDKINSILKDVEYIKYLKELEELEKERIFCKHNMEHFLDMSRIAYIKVLERKIDVSKDVIYAVGLLHDIGRVLEYKEGIPHHEASVILAKDILERSIYDEKEKELILSLIKSHREKDETKELEKLIYESDKESRSCFNCNAYNKCYWSVDKKNNIIKY